MRNFKHSTFILLAVLCICSRAAIRVPISKTTLLPRRLVERDDTTESLFHNISTGGGTYFATIEVGTPPQSVEVVVDTGSSDLWVLTTTTDLCTNATLQAEVKSGCLTPFNTDDSSSLESVSKGTFVVGYGDGSHAEGDFVKDTVVIGGTEILGVQLGISVTSNQSTGLMGVGYTTNEALSPVGLNVGLLDPITGKPRSLFTYPTIIDQLVNSKAINIAAYSMYLDDLDSSTGSILFGGLDTDKFFGDLAELAVVPEKTKNGTDLFRELTVALTGLALSDSIANSSSPITFAANPDSMSVPVVVDSGTAFSLLPTELFLQLVELLGAVADPTGSIAMALADCDLITQKPGITVDFDFKTTSGGTTIIRVPITEMVLPPSKIGYNVDDIKAAVAQLGLTLPFTNICLLGANAQANPPYILGDTFMRSAYAVFDLKNNLIGLANTNFNSNTTKIVDFEASQTKLPQASGTSAAPSSTKTGAGSRNIVARMMAVIGGSLATAFYLCN